MKGTRTGRKGWSVKSDAWLLGEKIWVENAFYFEIFSNIKSTGFSKLGFYHVLPF